MNTTLRHRTRLALQAARRPALALVLAGVCFPADAAAVIHPASVIYGPANDLLDVDGAAMAPDGTGGIVYRREVAGAAHVFVNRFLNGRWGSPVQVDGGNPFGATVPAIAAGNGGRLLVVWVQPRNVTARGITLYELMGASLQPGAGGFGAGVLIDPNVGEPYSGDASAVNPSLAMNPSSGQAYVTYRVITSDCSNLAGDPPNSACPPGNSTDKLVEVRVARFRYLTWSALGAVNRAAQLAMRNPTQSNAPAIGIDLNGNGVVAWQEPGSDGIARIWVRRLFGNVQGNVLEASPETLGGNPVTADADAPAVAVSGYGEARIAYRIAGSPGSAMPATRLFLNSISSALGLKAAQLNGVVALPGGSQAGAGAPSVAIDSRGNFRLAWTQSGTAQELSGDDEAVGSSLTVGSSTGSFAPTAVNPAGGGITAWTAAPGGLAAVDVREDYPHGGFQLAQLAGGLPGQIVGLALGGSGQGDALLAWAQGRTGQSEVIGDLVQAPPAPFNVQTPSSWVRGAVAGVSWEATSDAVAGVTYTVYVDGVPRLRELTGLAAQLRSRGLGDGVHGVQVLATDGAAQQTMSSEHSLKIDANPPTVKVSMIDRRRGVRVRIRDGASGVDARAIRVSFGDGQRSGKRATAAHEYRKAGPYTITVRVRDKVGNRATVHIRVRAR